MQGTYSGADKRLKYLFEHATEASISDTLGAGDEIATFTIDGHETIIKSPKYSTVTYSAEVATGTLIGIITINGTPHNIYSPVASEVTYEDLMGETVSVPDYPYNEPAYKVGTLTVDETDIPIYTPPVMWTTYESNYNQGIVVGKIVVKTMANDPDDETTIAVIDTQQYDIIIPGGGGGGGVEDVFVNGRSVVDQFGYAQIDLTGYQTSLQSDIDRIYNVCVSMGHTPPSHGFADVMLTAMSTLGGIQSRNVESTLDMNMRYFGHAKEV